MKKSTCQNCGADFIGRSNQRYCTTSCKAAYNNSKASLQRLFTRDIDMQLKRNYQIVKSLLADCGKIELSRQKFLATGYELSYMTHLAKDDLGKTGRGLYDFLILEAEDKIIITKH